MRKPNSIPPFILFGNISLYILLSLLLIFIFNVNLYSQQNFDIEHKLIASDGSFNDFFGSAVSIDSNVAIIGAPDHDFPNGSNSGAAYIFRFEENSWVEEQKLFSLDGNSLDYFASSVDISKDIAVVGVWSDGDILHDAGSAYVFKYNGNQWVQEAKLIASVPIFQERFGWSVSIYDSTVVIGATNSGSPPHGAVYVFQYMDSVWVQQAKLTPSVVTSGIFGDAVDIYDKTIIIGNKYDNDIGTTAGAAYVFQFDGSNWIEQQKLFSSDIGVSNEFGSSVSIFQNTAAIGAVGNESYSGSVYIFQYDGNNWAEEAKLKASDYTASAKFGASVDILEDVVMVGNEYWSTPGTVYFFREEMSGWAEIAKLTSTDGANGDNFGKSVALNVNKSCIIGANANDNPNGLGAGAAYFYELIARPSNVSCTNGKYNNRTKISWTNRSITAESNKIFRNGEEYDTALPGASSYYDYDAAPGKVYNYGIAAYNSKWGDSPIVSALGWRRPNGRLDGNVHTAHGAGVGDVKVSVAPSSLDITNVLNFDGIDDYVNCSNNPVLDFRGTDPFTLEAWIQPGINNATGAIISKYNTSNDSSYYLGIDNGLPIFYREGASGPLPATTVLQAGYWYHLAASFDGSDMRLYVDGVLENSMPAGSSNSSNSDVLIGALQAGGTIASYFTGKMDEIRVWKVARDSVLIIADMNRLLKGNEAGLLAYWSFDDSTRCSAAFAGDFAEEGGNHGSIFGALYLSDSSNVELYATTDPNGDYTIRDIYYDESREFEIKPYKEEHGFNPAYRHAFLDIYTPTVTSINFTDTTTFTVGGNIKYANTNCNVKGVEIFVDGIPTGIYTDAQGNFKISIDEPGTYTLTPSFSDSGLAHGFKPADTTLFIDENDFGITFQDTTTNLLYGKVRGPCTTIIGVADLEIVSINHNDGFFRDTLTTDSIGNFRFFLPAQPYWIKLIDINPYNPLIIQYFSSDTVDLTWKNRRKNYTYRTPPIIKISGFYDIGGGNYQIPIVEQHVNYRLFIEVLDTWEGDTCHVDEGEVTIYDGIGDKANEPVTLPLLNGIAVYTCYPGKPNILSGGMHPFQKLMQVVAQVGEETVTKNQWALVTGHRPRQQTFYNTSPELVLWVLRDPPGDQSYSFLAQDSSLSTFITQNFEWSTGHGAVIDLNPGVIISVGEIVTTDLGVYAFIRGDFYRIWEEGRSEGKMITFTATEEFQTSDDDVVVGDAGDVFIGASFSMVYALTDVIDFDWTTNQVVRDTSVAWDIDSVSTTFIYTESHIKNTLIPQLEELRSLALSANDTVRASKYLKGIERWKEELFRNEELKNAAEFKRNISFSAGTSTTFTETEIGNTSSTHTVADAWDAHWSVGAGVVIAGCTYEVGYQGSYYQNTISDTTFDTLYTRTIGYHFGDDDPGDFFSVNEKYDHTYRTHVFDLVAGTSSCPWEKGTQPRDGVQLNISTYAIHNVPPDEQAAFILNLGNTSQSGEEREYYLSVIQQSNPDGAIIRVGGVVIEDHLAYTIPAGEQYTATLSVERGPIAFDYENLQLRLYSPCDEEQIADTVTFSVHYISPCSDVTLLMPEDNWVLNQSDNDTLPFIISEYDVNNPQLESLKFQYRRYGENWETAFMYPKSQLPSDYILDYWDVSNLADGQYELRAVSDCGSSGINYSGIAAGVIDRQALLVFGMPEPSDGVLNIGEDISISFSGEIDESSINLQNISLITMEDSVAIAIDVVSYQNTIIITPLDSLANFSNLHLSATVADIRDIHGNRLRKPESWSFRVSMNPVYWTVSNQNKTVYQGATESFTRTLRNAGGQNESFSIAGYPNWLTPSPLNGSIPPGGEQEITFSINTQLNVGSYRDTVFVATSQGDEQLLVRLDVLKEPPGWMINPAQYAYSMNITAQVVLNDSLSKDIFDMLSVFVGDECRGVANIEFVAPVNKCLAFLTVYSNQSSGEILEFRAWDASQGREQVFLGTDYIFQSNLSLGTASDPLLVEPDAFVQSINLNQGWNWWSGNVVVSDSSVARVLSNLTPADGDLIKGQNGFCQYHSNAGWQGNLQSLDIGMSYRLYLNDTETMRLTGLPVDLFNTPLPIDTGWNWIGYLPQEILDINQAMAAYSAAEGDRIKSQTEFAEYIANSGSWEGSLKNMVPGEGYLLKSQNGGSLAYPSFNKGSGSNLARILFFQEKPDWSVDVPEFEFNMSVTSMIEFDEKMMSDSTLIVGAFVDEACRGIARLVDLPGLEKHVAFLLIYSNNEEGDSVCFRIYEPVSEKTRQVEESLIFQSDQILGDLETPFIFTAMPLGDELVPYDFYLNQNYPNPFNPTTILEYGLPRNERVKLIIYNILGQKIATLVDAPQRARHYKITFDSRKYNLASGLYFYRIKAGNFEKIRKMLIIK